MTIKQAIRTLTRSNRRTPDQIAKYLFKQGIKGRRFWPYSCPVAEWIQRECGGIVVQVGRVNIIYRWQNIPVPESLTQFITAFDNCCYPALEARKTDRVYSVVAIKETP